MTAHPPEQAKCKECKRRCHQFAHRGNVIIGYHLCSCVDCEKRPVPSHPTTCQTCGKEKCEFWERKDMHLCMAYDKDVCHGHTSTNEPTENSQLAREAELAAPCEDREKTAWWNKWEEDFGLPTHECDVECDEDCPNLSVDVKIIDVYDFIADLLEAKDRQAEERVQRVVRAANRAAQDAKDIYPLADVEHILEAVGSAALESSKEGK